MTHIKNTKVSSQNTSTLLRQYAFVPKASTSSSNIASLNIFAAGPVQDSVYESMPFVCFNDLVKTTPFKRDALSSEETFESGHQSRKALFALPKGSFEPESPITPGLNEGLPEGVQDDYQVGSSAEAKRETSKTNYKSRLSRRDLFIIIKKPTFR